jgi:drug/metabolite transporter (DMT)-like permease
MLIYIIVTKKSFKPVDFRPIWDRTIFNSISIILFSGSLKYTTITNANMLNMIYPVFVIILAPYVLGEVVNKSKYIYLITIMLGTYVVADPNFGSINRGDLMSFASSITAAISMLNLTKARIKNEGYLIEEIA